MELNKSVRVALALGPFSKQTISDWGKIYSSHKNHYNWFYKFYNNIRLIYKMKVSVRKSFQFVVKSSFDNIHNSKSQILLSNFESNE